MRRVSILEVVVCVTMVAGLSVTRASAESSTPAASSSPSSSPTPSPSSAMKTVSAEQFSISVPADWETRKDSVPQIPVVAAPKAVLGTKDEFPNLKVAVMPMREGLTLAMLGEASKLQWSKIWNVQSDQMQKIGGRDARIMVIDQTLNLAGGKSVKSRVMKMFIIGSGNYYIVTGASTLEDYPKNEPLFTSMLSTFVPR